MTPLELQQVKKEVEKSYRRGAREERRDVLAKIVREVSQSRDTVIDGGILVEWIRGRKTRYRARTGGL